MAKTVLVTGGSGGIGLELARRFAADGYDVVLVARNEEKLQEAARELHGRYGIKTEVIVQDLSEDRAVIHVVNAIDERGITVDALVNNAGFGLAAPFVESVWERQRALVRVDVEVLVELSHVFGHRMAQQGSGAILNVASIAGFMPGPYMSTYYAAKAFVQSFSQALHTELRSQGVVVTVLCPGPVRTKFFSSAGFGPKSVFNVAAIPASYVAWSGYRALRHGRAQCAPGLFAKVTILFTRIAPRILMRGIVTLLQKPTALAGISDGTAPLHDNQRRP